MRKLLIVLAFAGVSAASMAQNTNTVPTEKYSVATNSFWSNWFVQVGGQWNAWYSDQEVGKGLSKNPFKSFRSGQAISFSVGKWFTPGIGLRTKFAGIWGKTVLDDNKNTNKYWTANEQVLFNLSNMFFGYNPTRVWNFIPFAGAGISRSCTYNRYGQQLSAGLLNEFNVSKRVAFNVELGWNLMTNDGDGVVGSYNKRGLKGHDNDLYAEVGLTFNLGKTGWEKTPDVAALQALSKSQLDALNAQLSDEQAENAKLKDALANQKPAEPTVTKEFVNTPISVFFNLGKSEIASKKDLVNIKALASYAKDNNSKITVTGNADSATGSAKYNKKLSEKRANKIADVLVKLGISRDNISIVANGGVDTLSPVSYNRRAIVQIAQ